MTATPPSVGYLRLIAGVDRAGVFSAAFDLQDSSEVSAATHANLSATLRWFARELDPHMPSEPAAVFWFRADAIDHVRQVWHLVQLLQRHDREVLMLTCRCPGRIVYRDVYQVAAVPHRTARPAVKQLPAYVERAST